MVRRTYRPPLARDRDVAPLGDRGLAGSVHAEPREAHVASTPDRIEAVIFDTDGVVTRTASVHQAAWKRVFDDELRHRLGPDAAPFSDDDYRRHVDGRPRQDKMAAFLSSRGIHLPPGSSDDPPGHDTVHAVGNAKNDAFLAEVTAHGVEAYASTVAFVDQLCRLPNVFTDTSGVRYFDVLADAARRAGPHKILFGSDGPLLHPAVELAKARLLARDPEGAALILGGNLLRLTARTRNREKD